MKLLDLLDPTKLRKLIVDNCKVMYKCKGLIVGKDAQRVTVAAYENTITNTYNIGITIKSLKDAFNKNVAQLEAGKRALFNPSIVVTINRKTVEGKAKELHKLMRKIKKQFELNAFSSPIVEIPIAGITPYMLQQITKNIN